MKKIDALEANLRRINPELQIETLDLRLDAANIRHTFRTCAIVVEALDQAADKKMMAEAFMSDGRTLICASGIGGWGDSDRICTRRIGSSLYLVGDGQSEVSADLPPTAAIVGIAAAKQADVVVEIILGSAAVMP
jgi:sulfur carrier protein ThiS adenylyltransferase